MGNHRDRRVTDTSEVQNEVVSQHAGFADGTRSPANPSDEARNRQVSHPVNPRPGSPIQLLVSPAVGGTQGRRAFGPRDGRGCIG